MWRKLTAGTLILGASLGAATLATKLPILSVPEAQKSEKLSNPNIQGVDAIVVITANTKALKKLSQLFTISEKDVLDKHGKVVGTQDIILFDNREIQVFYVTTDALYEKVISDLDLAFTGGTIYTTLPDDAENRAAKFMHEHGIKTYEIITL